MRLNTNIIPPAGWNPMSTLPVDGTPVLLALERAMLGSRVHAGVFRKDRMGHLIGTIGCLFGFDAPKPIGWLPQPAIDTLAVPDAG